MTVRALKITPVRYRDAEVYNRSAIGIRQGFAMSFLLRCDIISLVIHEARMDTLNL